MYNNGERFRCHFLSIFSALIKTIVGFMVIFYSCFLSEENMDDTVAVVRDLKNGEFSINNKDSMGILIAVIGLIAFFLLYIAISIIIWSRTYITVVDNAILFEKSFIGTKKKSISIINISNINLEQSMIQRILGISTVKLDTNSRTTADKTDFEIILKTNKAKEFKDAINQLLKEAKLAIKEQSNDIIEDSTVCISSEKEKETYEERETFKLEANKDEIIRHGLLNQNIVTIVITIVSLVIGMWLMLTVSSTDASTADSANSISTIIIIMITCIGEIYSIIKGFFKFFNYKIRRIEDKIYINYGMFQKVEYTIPVDKINAIQLKQSFFARITNKYRVDIVNVGIGDDDKEKNSFLLLYDSKENILDKLSRILPEYDIEPTLNYEKQPGISFGLNIFQRIYNMAQWLIIPALSYVVKNDVADYILIVWIVLTVISIISGLVETFTEGVAIEDKYIKLVSGLTERTYTWIAYDKIEILNINSNIVSRKYGIVSGNIKILAATIKSTYTIPYMKTDNAHILRKKVLEQINN